MITTEEDRIFFPSDSDQWPQYPELDANGVNSHPAGCAEPDPTNALAPQKLGAIWTEHPQLREWILDGLLRRGEVGNLISTSKSYKTYLILGLAISFVKGSHWLDTYPTRKGRVLIIDMELTKGSITKRTLDIAKAMHAELASVGNDIDVISLRGCNTTIDEIEKIIFAIAAGTYMLVIVDPLYKTYPDNFDENSNAQMTALYRRWERMAEHLDAGLLIVHHASKGGQADKRTVDVGSGAGAQARSPDCHIAIREHEVDDCVVLDAKVRSFKPPVSIVMKWNYPLWQREVALDPTNLKTGKKARNTDKPDIPVKEEPIPWTAERFVNCFITTDAKSKALIVARARQAGIKNRQVDDLLALAIAEKLAFQWSFTKDRTIYYATTEQAIICDKDGVVS